MKPWEQAVREFRSDPANTRAVRDNYFDLPVTAAATRYARSREFRALRRMLGSPGRLLDLGAGNGVTTYAFASQGWRVDAVEPDPSPEVGAEAIRNVCRGLDVRVHLTGAEALPVESGVFDAVHGRQVLHHVQDLAQALREVRRVLKPTGRAVFTREHVADDEVQLEAFLSSHPLHRHYGGEHAYPLPEYLTAFDAAGLTLVKALGPLESPINYFPASEPRRYAALLRAVVRAGDVRAAVSAGVRSRALERASRAPGRLYTFLVRVR